MNLYQMLTMTCLLQKVVVLVLLVVILVSEIIAAIVKKEPIKAMKEVNKVIGKKGKYKNLTEEDINKIVEGTDDWIMQRDPDNLYMSTMMVKLFTMTILQKNS